MGLGNKLFKFKLAKMRKEQEWIVYPRQSPNDPLKVQSDKSIGLILNTETGEGRLNTKGCYAPALMTAEPFTFPMEFVKLALENEYKKGDEIVNGGHVIIG